jgi:hypothetical protein
MTTIAEWATALLEHAGWSVTADKLHAFAAWHQKEGGHAEWNPLNTTEPAEGATDYNSAGVKNYPSMQSGIEATLATLTSCP